VLTSYEYCNWKETEIPQISIRMDVRVGQGGEGAGRARWEEAARLAGDAIAADAATDWNEAAAAYARLLPTMRLLIRNFFSFMFIFFAFIHNTVAIALKTDNVNEFLRASRQESNRIDSAEEVDTFPILEISLFQFAK
jgi:hypothetical protein